MTSHPRNEGAFDRWGRLVVRRPWTAILATLACSGFFLSWLPQLTLDNAIESFMLPEDPAYIRYNQFRDDFDRDDRISIAIVAPDPFSLEFLERLRAFHDDLERELPYTEKITSLLNVRHTRGEHDGLVVGELVEDWPQDEADLEALRERVMGNPLYLKTLISPDTTLTTVMIKPFTYSTRGGPEEPWDFEDGEPTPGLEPRYLTGPENDELMETLYQVVARHRAPSFALHVAGALAMTDAINHHLMTDTALFMGLAVVAILVMLLAVFRRIGAAILPLLVVTLALYTTLGIMVMLDIPGSTSVQILPAFLMTVGVCDAVHILTIVYQQLGRGLSKPDAIVFALGHSGLAVVMTSLTTAAGLMSFVTAGLAPVVHLGIIAPIGILLALAYTLVLLPALLVLSPLGPPRIGRAAGRDGGFSRWLVRTGDFSARHPWGMLAGALLFVALCVPGIARVRFAHNGLEWLPPSDPLRQAFEVIDRGLEGSVTLEVLIDTGRENGLHDPEMLRRVEAAMRHAETLGHAQIKVGKAISIVDIVEEVNQALNENRATFHAIPESRQLVAQELLLFEQSGSEDLEEWVDHGFRTARISLRVSWVDALLYPAFLEQIETDFRKILGPEISFQATGLMTLLARIFTQLIASMTRSYAFALLVITPMMMLLLRSVRMGLISMIPNLIPVLFTLGLMGWLEVPLDASTILIGAIVIGLAVDDTIHFMHGFRRHYASSGDARLAVSETLATTGTALLITSLVLSAGFFVLSFGYLINMASFGLLASLATLVAFGVDLLLGPALMVLVARWKSADRVLRVGVARR